MRILMLNWKDLRHPSAGGAEVLTHSVAEHWVRTGHQVTLVTAGFPGAPSEENMNGVRIVRGGGRLSVYWKAARYVSQHHHDYHVVIDQINTLPFWTPLYVPKEKRLMLIHQLAREVWFFELPRWLGWIGYLAEPLFLRFYRHERVVTVSDSTRSDLLALGFEPDQVRIIPEGIDIEPLQALEAKSPLPPTYVFAGRLTPMKRVDHLIRAFRLVKERLPEAQLSLVGSGAPTYVQQLKDLARGLDGVKFHGRVSQEEKRGLMKAATAIVGASVREGWGLFVSEGAVLGAPSVVYGAPGLRDSTIDGVTGLVAWTCTPEELADRMVELVVDRRRYETLRTTAWERARSLTWDRSAAVFLQSISELLGRDLTNREGRD